MAEAPVTKATDLLRDKRNALRYERRDQESAIAQAQNVISHARKRLAELDALEASINAVLERCGEDHD